MGHPASDDRAGELWQHALVIRLRLIHRADMPHVMVVMVPWARERPHPEQVIQEEEPTPQQTATAAPQRA